MSCARRVSRICSRIRCGCGGETPGVSPGRPVEYGTTEDFLELNLLTADQDSSFNYANEDRNGEDLASYIWSLLDEGGIVTVQDGYSVGPYEDPRSFSCFIEDVDHQNTKEREGRVILRLRVVA